MKFGKFRYDLDKPIHIDGGKPLIERLIHLFKLSNRLELAEIIGVSVGTLSTWTTRSTVPHELLLRLHFATGANIEYLCFGTGPEFPHSGKQSVDGVSDVTAIYAITEPDEALSLPIMKVKAIDNGKLVPYVNYRIDANAMVEFGLFPKQNDFVIKQSGKYFFISSTETTVTDGQYLYSVGGIHKIGEMKLLPDNKVYLIDSGERYEVDLASTKIHGKVVSVLARC
ncbi:helix-turn-helix domain-containing protein [Shewanella sp.]|uniref:helix-turn-helix domain-containing protein n=1 Tax=Shewanella sp. TaxID=50422 RepID=UPI003A96D8D1